MSQTTNSKRVGILGSHVSGRPDLHALIHSFSKQSKSDCVLFEHNPSHEGASNRPIKGSRRTFYFKLAKSLFCKLGQLPLSKQNYLIAELFKLSSVGGIRKYLQKIFIYVRVYNPIPLPLSFYHWLIQHIDKSDIDDIDIFLLLSEISDDAFVARLNKLKKPTFLYVYSWDHPCKHANIPTNLTGYFVWNEGVAEDLVRLAGVPRKRITIVGSTQMSPLAKYKISNKQKTSQTQSCKTIYFGSAVGYPSLARVEAKFAQAVYQLCLETEQPFKFVFRPYPFLSDWSEYDDLKGLGNVEFDTWKRPPGKDWLTMNEQVVNQRYKMLENADIFFHMGTTMGLECCFFDTPSILIDSGCKSNFPDQYRHRLMENFCDQYHLNQHMKMSNFSNVVRSLDDLRNVIRQLFDVAKNQELLAYNKEITSNFELKSIDQIQEKITEIFTRF